MKDFPTDLASEVLVQEQQKTSPFFSFLLWMKGSERASVFCADFSMELINPLLKLDPGRELDEEI